MKEFKNLAELKADKELQTMSRYSSERVLLNGKEVIACRTNQGYEDIIWGNSYEMLEELNKKYPFKVDIDTCELASQIRDFTLNALYEQYGIEFVDVFDEY